MSGISRRPRHSSTIIALLALIKDRQIPTGTVYHTRADGCVSTRLYGRVKTGEGEGKKEGEGERERVGEREDRRERSCNAKVIRRSSCFPCQCLLDKINVPWPF